MTPTAATITIPAWANGPDDSANGGHAAGLVAATLGDAQFDVGVDVSLRFPPPLNRALVVTRDEAMVRVVDELDRDPAGEPRLIAHAAPCAASIELDVPAAVLAISVDQATASAAGFPYRTDHPFPRCVCCGIARDDAHALNLHAGQVAGSDVFADRWTPSGEISHVMCWSALDCPSATPFAHPDRPAVLARFEVRLAPTLPRAGDELIVAAWERGRDGRKLSSSSAIVDPVTGTVFGVARALWIEVRQP